MSHFMEWKRLWLVRLLAWLLWGRRDVTVASFTQTQHAHAQTVAHKSSLSGDKDNAHKEWCTRAHALNVWYNKWINVFHRLVCYVCTTMSSSKTAEKGAWSFRNRKLYKYECRILWKCWGLSKSRVSTNLIHVFKIFIYKQTQQELVSTNIIKYNLIS